MSLTLQDYKQDAFLRKAGDAPPMLHSAKQLEQTAEAVSMPYHDEVLQQVQGLANGRLPIKLMMRQLLIHNSLQALCQDHVLLQKAVFLLLYGGIEVLQLLLLLFQLLQLPAANALPTSGAHI